MKSPHPKAPGNGPMQHAIRRLLADGLERPSELARALDMPLVQVCVKLSREVKAGRLERVGVGRYALPGATTLVGRNTLVDITPLLVHGLDLTGPAVFG